MYKIISTSSDPLIIGVNNGIYQVELIENKSFVNKKERQYYENFFDGEFNSFTINNFRNVESEEISELIYFPLKKAKETDFVSFSPYEMGLNFLVSQKVIKIMDSFSVGDYIKIPSKIEGFNNIYYTIGFPIFTEDVINFFKSKFCHLIEESELNNLSKDDYKKVAGALVKTINLELVKNDSLNRDIINLEGQGLFFSTPLLLKLNKENITGLEVGQTSLEIR
ncbi:hypothetical protein [Dysgonomonas sp. 511]|uniref:hypothetical protein n=1 Tax=Dysgonomonas sp. 511 TaxID=2302930 RepID=UPI0013D7B41B|nr:hypothetical protein [Dysgonomonas sp. 511]NDV78463.1 hypothetical protein [Dysgonomonas sp. 511]